MYHHPVQSPIHPPYEQAVALKKKGGLAKLSSNMVSLSLSDSASPEEVSTASIREIDVSSVLDSPKLDRQEAVKTGGPEKE